MANNYQRRCDAGRHYWRRETPCGYCRAETDLRDGQRHIKRLADIQVNSQDAMSSLQVLIGKRITDLAGAMQNVVGVGPAFVIQRIDFEDGSWMNVVDGCVVNGKGHPQPFYDDEQLQALVDEWNGDDT